MSNYVSVALRRKVIADAGHRCGYCQTDERLSGIPLSVEHIVPRSRGGTSTRANLWMACRSCNEFKGAQVEAEDPATGDSVPLFNPRTQRWDEHFGWSENATSINGLSAVGRATVAALQMNRPLLVLARKRWTLNGWHPPIIGD